jgi:hypothetical protein
MNGDQAIGGANHFHLVQRGGSFGAAKRVAAERGVAAVYQRPVEHVQDAVVVDAPVKVGSALAAHAPTVNTSTASQRTSAILVYQAAEK